MRDLLDDWRAVLGGSGISASDLRHFLPFMVLMDDQMPATGYSANVVAVLSDFCTRAKLDLSAPRAQIMERVATYYRESPPHPGLVDAWRRLKSGGNAAHAWERGDRARRFLGG